jgi:Protein of unknown function (DUF4013)
MPLQLSPDGSWYWNGQVWMPVPPAQRSLMWFTSAPNWATPTALMALIELIPIVGQIIVFGWALEAKDEQRRDRNLVPPAGFTYLERGWRPFLASLLYGLGWLVLLMACGVLLAIAVTLAGTHGGGWDLLVAAAVLLMAGVGLGGLFLLLFLWTPMMLVADERGLGAALNPPRLWRTATANAGASWRAFGIFGGAYLVAAFLSLVIPVFGHAFIVTAATLGAASPMAEMDAAAGD